MFTLLRAYSKEFGFNLAEIAAQHRPVATMRQKVSVDPRATDLEVFVQLELGDHWPDADLISVYKYLRQGTTVPDTWQSAMSQFDKELSSKGLL